MPRYDDDAPLPPTPVDTARSWGGESKTVRSHTTKWGKPHVKSDTTSSNYKKVEYGPGKELKGCNEGTVLQAKLRPTGIKLDLGKGTNAEEPFYRQNKK